MKKAPGNWSIQVSASVNCTLMNVSCFCVALVCAWARHPPVMHHVVCVNSELNWTVPLIRRDSNARAIVATYVAFLALGVTKRNQEMATVSHWTTPLTSLFNGAPAALWGLGLPATCQRHHGPTGKHGQLHRWLMEPKLKTRVWTQTQNIQRVSSLY